MTSTDIQALASQLEQLQARLRQLEDEREIRELLSVYGYTADLGHEERYAALWTSDGNYDWDGANILGTDGLVDLVKNPEGEHKRNIENRSQHVAVNPLIRVEGDTAWVEVYSILVVGTPDVGYRIYTAGYNHFDLRRVDGIWRITHRLRRAVGGPVWGGEVVSSFQNAR